VAREREEERGTDSSLDEEKRGRVAGQLGPETGRRKFFF